MHCPDCSTLLEGAPGACREHCPRCAGEWFELPALALTLRSAAPAEAGRGPLPPRHEERGAFPLRRCPVCRAALRSRDWAATHPPQAVALCPLGHGAWLPSGQIALLQEGAGRARDLLHWQGPYFTLLARSAARQFERSVRPGQARRGRRGPLARLLVRHL